MCFSFQSDYQNRYSINFSNRRKWWKPLDALKQVYYSKYSSVYRKNVIVGCQSGCNGRALWWKKTWRGNKLKLVCWPFFLNKFSIVSVLRLSNYQEPLHEESQRIRIYWTGGFSSPLYQNWLSDKKFARVDCFIEKFLDSLLDHIIKIIRKNNLGWLKNYSLDCGK